MVVNRTTARDTFADAYGVHVKDAYELVKMAKKPEHNELGKLKITERVITYNNSDGNFYGESHGYPDVLLDLSQLQPLLDQLVNSERPFDKERFKNFEMDMSPENYRSWFARHSDNCHDIIRLDETLKEIVGFGRICKCSINDDHKYLYVYNFVVSDKCRGKGIGKNMLQRFENVAFNTKCDYIVLSCYRVNKAIKLYKSLGFNEIKGYHELWEQ